MSRSDLKPVDELNINIIRYLRDGRRSFSEIAKKLSITTNTVRARVTMMIKNKLLSITGLIDPDLVPDHFLAIVAIKLSVMDLVNKGREFSKLKGVISVGVVTGRYDLMLTVLLNNEFGLMEFYTQEVAKIKDVQSAETFVLYKNYNWKVPYAL